ncbi:hypothetical protein WJX82_009397 [Trebouxia sp. C0006]
MTPGFTTSIGALALMALTTTLAPAGLAAETASLSSPGCTKLSDTFIYTDPDYSTIKQLLNLPQIGLNNILTSLKSPATLFAPNNETFALYAIGSNVSNDEALKSPLLAPGVNLLVVPEALLNTSDFHDGEGLPTFVKGQNLTVIYQQVNTTEVITIQSPGSAGHIFTPPNYACNLVIYGITGAFVPQQNIQVQNQGTPGAVHNITQYIETVLIPGGPVTSLNTVLTAANQGQLDQVAAGFNTAVAHNYTSQLIDIVRGKLQNPLSYDASKQLMTLLQGCVRPAKGCTS